MHTLEQLKSGALIGATAIKLSADLTELPVELYELADTLEILDLSGNKLSKLPEEVVLLKKIRILFLSNNQFTVFPSVLNKCAALDIVGFKSNRIHTVPENSIPVSLRWLILTDNCIEILPKSIGMCFNLQKVMLAGNRLTSLPATMAACKNIELLRISANNIVVFPEWLLSLPRLSWLAYAGNPCSILQQQHHATTLPQLSWKSFIIEEQLGEGASGFIFKAYWKNTHNSCAIKIFKGAVTSDGLPYDEMQAYIRAGKHGNLVQVLGEIVQHPEEKNGLVMSLIAAEYKNLGGPPDFITCSRDTFSKEQSFSVHTILSIVKGIASVVAQLHENGVMHGDLYAHNILINTLDHPLLGDFGAATRYDRSSVIGKMLERIEVRAFGCLLDDLFVRIDKNSTDNAALLESLRDRCFETHIVSRPDFKEIKELLELIQV